MKVYFSPQREALVFTGRRPDPQGWDDHWAGTEGRATVPRRSLVRDVTRAFLAPGSRILEAGCGLGQHSAALVQAGYRAVALDFAPRTLGRVAETFPETSPVLGDVRRLPLRTASFDGLWSLGVIEHFLDGFDPIRDEAARVLRPGGFLFLTFPAMNLLRRWKARLGLYPVLDRGGLEEVRADFYQYALEPTAVAADFARHGFEWIRTRRYLGATGLEADIPALRRVLASAGTLGRALTDRTTRRVAGHIALLVLRRTGRSGGCPPEVPRRPGPP